MHLTLVLIHSKLKYLHTSVHKRICFHNTKHRRWKYGCCSPNSLRPISYFGSIWELCVLDLETKVFLQEREPATLSYEQGTHSDKIELIVWPEKPQMPHKISAQFACPSPNVSNFCKKLSLGVRSPYFGPIRICKQDC